MKIHTVVWQLTTATAHLIGGPLFIWLRLDKQVRCIWASCYGNCLSSNSYVTWIGLQQACQFIGG